eukprot:CAMPEP_0113554158 /NCGR_PEP_ID=MMETSP0015_2-20120614/15997_1 /TAXON_ID=2838 /ORGANISM="Odontella" /LENGTH=517 /DNA_ID=CAMNT_0000455275 /DNA_START=16 /DNA_END=1569 /DNA_ORIENTATION=- /assembly_acc=CAM_ASM_000160
MAAPAPPSPNEPKTTGYVKASAKTEDDHGSGDKAAVAIAAETGPASAALPLTYANTKNSDSYSSAKAKMKEGDFEGALEAVETALKTTLSLLPNADELHESLAPLYYMYGTTLLYSIEESTESAESSVMIQQQQQEGGASVPSENAEDLQIAWENLDTARAIVSRIATSSHFAKSASIEPANAEGRDLVLDLAQIHARLGDLQCANGNYGPALADFSRALDVRLKALGKYDRRVADVYYRLGTTCVALAAEGEKARQQAAVKGDGGSASAGGDGEAAAMQMTPAQIAEHREQSITHFLSCGRTLGGIVGKMCDKDPDEIAAVPSSSNAEDVGDNSDSDDDEASPGKGKGKAKAAASSSDGGGPHKSAASVYAASSAALRDIREHVANLRPSESGDADAVLDLRELMDEIQEAIDTAREDLQGLSDVSEMKAKAEADIEKADRVALEEGVEASRNDVASGGVTTVGFGAQTLPTAAATTSATTANKAVPMMVVKKKKKKKKRDDEGQDKDDSKRAKTE